GSMDTLGVAFWLREQSYEVGKPLKTLVYSSEKNWWLEARPLSIGPLETKAGKFEKAVKLNLQTYIGSELQQKGDVNLWIDMQGKSRAILMIQAEIQLGSIWIEMINYKAGS